MGGSVRQRRRRARAGGLAALALVLSGVAAGGATSPSAAAAEEPATADTSSFVPLEPFRLADTRSSPCGCDEIDDRTIEIDATGHPSIPDDAVAVAVTITAVAPVSPSFVTAYPGDRSRPTAATLNARPDRNVSNTGIIALGDDGTLRIFRRVRGDVVVDVSGAFVPAETATDGRYVPVAGQRLVDSRIGLGAAGALSPGGGVVVPIPDGIPADAGALVVNVASVGAVQRGNLAVRPVGTARSTTAFMTVSGSGGVVSNATIAPLSPDGFVVRSTAGGHLVIDLVGWFTGPSADDTDVGLFVPVEPRRLRDTREDGPRVWPGGTIEVPVGLDDAAAVVTNLAVTHADRRTFTTAYPAGTARPNVATLNAAFYDHTIANLAISQVSDRGIAYHALAGVDVVVDLTGYFTGRPVAATRAPEPNIAPHSRVLLVGDSTLAGLDVATSSQRALVGFEGIVDAASCRRLVRPSCLSNVTGVIPNTAVEAILTTPGTLDVVVVKTGYNDWFSDFPAEFAATVDAARAKGAHTILWFSYNEELRDSNGRVRTRAGQAYRENNADLYRLVDQPEYADVMLADWREYSLQRPDWFFDGTHTTTAGSFAITDYTARWIAAIEHRPCPRPRVPGGEVLDPCPIPDLLGPVPDPIAVNP